MLITWLNRSPTGSVIVKSSSIHGQSPVENGLSSPLIPRTFDETRTNPMRSDESQGNAPLACASG
jgi:hypothetical protein